MKPNPLRAQLAAFEKDAIEKALYINDGNVTAAAKYLDISRRVMTRKMNEHDLHDFAARLREKAGVTGPRS